MKIEISYPGQEIRIVDALPHIVEHFKARGWDLPFVKVLDEEIKKDE
jgi:hypothetical protein